MSQNAEHIEAKLCAYIDGALDATEIAEIEKHLAANPGHRVVIEELKRLRVMVHDLPRAAAPPDIAESIQGHLERAVLLDDQADDHVSDMRINRWPQIISIAAVLLLASGLGFVIYNMLPRAASPVVIAPPATQETEKQAPTTDHASVSPAKAENASANDKSQIDSAIVPPQARASVDKESVATAPQMEQAGEAPALNASNLQQVNALSAAIAGKKLDGASKNQPLVLVGVTPDVDALSNKLVSYFNTNNIQWETNPVGDDSLQDRVRSGATDNPAPAPEGPNTAASGSQSEASPPGAASGNAAPGVAGSAPQAPNAKSAAVVGAGRGAGSQSQAPQPEKQMATAAVPASTLPVPQHERFGQDAHITEESARESDNLKRAALRSEAAEGSDGSHRTVIVARGLTNTQFAQLTESLNQEHDARWTFDLASTARAESLARRATPTPGPIRMALSGLNTPTTGPATLPGSVATQTPDGAHDTRQLADAKGTAQSANGLARNDDNQRDILAHGAGTFGGSTTQSATTRPVAATTRPTPDLGLALRKSSREAVDQSQDRFDFVIVLQNTPLAAAPAPQPTTIPAVPTTRPATAPASDAPSLK